MQVLTVLAALAMIVAGLGCGHPPMDDDHPAHHIPGGFTNVGDYNPPGFMDFLKWRWERLWKDLPESHEPKQPNRRVSPLVFESGSEGRPSVTWLGHATLLVQTKNFNILTDPHLSRRASPVSWAGPLRLVSPPLAVDELPNIDVVVISHNHYDSLDVITIEKILAQPWGKSSRFFVPLGLKAWMNEHGVENVVEMDWWQERQSDGIKVTAVPTQHWSKRSLWGRNDSLWNGWVIEADSLRFYFLGDSGYSPWFKEIGQRLGPFDLAAIPIGAYEPRWFMKSHHMNPEEAVLVHRDVRSRQSIAMHWGTFILTDEPVDEPPRRLQKALSSSAIELDSFWVLEHGETRVLPQE